MIVTFHGKNYFKLQSGDLTVLIDPTNHRSSKGAAIAMHTAIPSFIEKPENETIFWADRPGEYEIQNIRIKGKDLEIVEEIEKTNRAKTAYRVEFPDAIALGVLGFGKEEPNALVQELFGGADILLAPAGSDVFWGVSRFASMVRQIEPAVVIVGFDAADEKRLEQIGKEFGKEKLVCEEKYICKKKDLSPGAIKFVCLKNI